MSVNARIVISALILTGCFIFMSVVTESLAIWGTLIGLGVVAVFVSLVIRVNKYDTYDYDTEASDKFMKNYLSFGEYQELKRSSEIFLGYRKDSITPIQPKSEKTKELPNVLDGDFLQALKDFYLLDVEKQENIVLSLKGDQKIRDSLKPLYKRLQVGYSDSDLIGYLQFIKTKAF